MDQLVNQINMLKEQMPPHPEATWAYTLLFALNLTIQEMILKQQGSFDIRNKFQKLAVELKALKTKKTKRRKCNGNNNVLYNKTKTCGQIHNHRVKKIKQRHATQSGGQTPNIQCEAAPISDSNAAASRPWHQ